MSTQNRKTWLLLLLALLVSHASLTLHASSHVAVEQQGCDLCTHYSGFEHGPPPAAPDAFPRPLVVPEPLHVDLLLPAARVLPCRQRGPPLPA